MTGCRTAALSLALTLALGRASAMTIGTDHFTCPIGGQTFTAQMAHSGTSFGMDLDRRQFGAIASPWPLAKCPDNGFVLFKREWSDAEIAQLTPYVLSPEYQAMQRRETSYYLAAQLMRRLGQPAIDVAWSLLQASWQASPDLPPRSATVPPVVDPRYASYAAEALAALDAALAHPDKAWADDAQQVAAELERRLGRFDAARTRLTALAAQLPDKGSVLAQMVRQELRLVEQRDARRHAVDPPAKPK